MSEERSKRRRLLSVCCDIVWRLCTRNGSARSKDDRRTGREATQACWERGNRLSITDYVLSIAFIKQCEKRVSVRHTFELTQSGSHSRTGGLPLMEAGTPAVAWASTIVGANTAASASVNAAAAQTEELVDFILKKLWCGV